MSITIYEGLRATTSNPFEVGRQIRAVLEPIFHAKFKAAFEKAKLNEGSTWSAVFFVENDAVIDSARADIDLYRIIRVLHNTPTHTFSELDIAYDVLLYQNAAGGNPLILVFGEHAREYRELLISNGVAEDYGYWDSTDEDQDVSPEEWEARRVAWSDFTDIHTENNSLMIPIPDSVETSVKLFRPFI